MSSALATTLGWVSRQLQKRQPYQSHNLFLEGVFAPVETEETAVDLTVTGKIPVALNGLLARIGPNPQEVNNPGLHHWFLGDGMVHGVRLKAGHAEWYRNRFVGVDDVNQRLERPRAPGKRRGVGDVVNTNIIGHAGSLWALVEAGAFPVEMDGTLATLRHGLFRSEKSLPFSAHPHRDPDTGELHAICYDPLKRNRVNYLVIGKQGELVRNVIIPVRDGPMIHDCAISASSVVIFDLPVTFSMKLALSGSNFPYAWNSEHPARVGLLPRNGDAKDVRWFAVDPCFVFHVANAFDRADGSTVVDVVVHERMFDRSQQGPETGRASGFERWTLTPGAERVERQVVSSEGQEFPRCDERRTGKPYRFAYAMTAILNEAMQPNALLRHDLENGTTQRHEFGPDCLASEAVFVPRHEAAAEDDGWLLCFVHRLDGGSSHLAVIDAQQMEAAPVATVELPVRVPLGFHGNWIAD